MKSRSSSSGSALACTALSLLCCCLAAAQAPPSRTPAVVLLDEADAPLWQSVAKETGWQVISPGAQAPKALDARIKALETSVREAEKGAVDATRVYLVGRGEAASAVFYTVSRVPDLWAAAVAIGGSPQAAIDTNRFFAANFAHVPLLWVAQGADTAALAGKLKSAAIRVELRNADGLTNAALVEWLAARRRDDFPPTIDCETGSPSFGSCYWVQMTKFDAAERNDVLPSSRLQPGSGASLDLGGFGFKPGDPGPGVLVSWLPEKYGGPLKLNDRIVALNGRELKDGAHYAELMSKIFEEAAATVMVQRGKDRLRLDTRVVLPKREEAVTARVQAAYLPAEKEIRIVSRAVTELRVTPPEAWMPAVISWNGTPLESVDKPGCWTLSMQKEIPSAKPCP
jgi:hypothetical protein